MSKIQMKGLEGTLGSEVKEVDALSTSESQSHNRSGSESSQGSVFHQSDRRFIQDCSKCGRSHVIRRCPAFFRKCSKCGAIGHFAVKCHTKQVQEMVVVREEQETQVVEKEEQPRLFVGMVETEKAAQSWTVELETHGRQVCYKLDTGSQVNVLPRNVYDSLKSPPALMQTRVKHMDHLYHY